MGPEEAGTTQFELTETMRDAIELVLREAKAILLGAKDKETFQRFLNEVNALNAQKEERLQRKQRREQEQLKKAAEAEAEANGAADVDASNAVAVVEANEAETSDATQLSKSAKKRQKRKNNKSKKQEEGAGVGSDLSLSSSGDGSSASSSSNQQSTKEPIDDEDEDEDEEKFKQRISLALVMRLSEILVNMKKNHKEHLPKDQPVYIHELTRGSLLVVKRLPQRKKDPAVQEKLRQVKIQLENRRYEEMTRKISGSTNRTKMMEEHAELKSYKSQMEIGINIIVTMATLFVGGYSLTKVSTGNHLYGLAVGVILAAGALMLESWLFIIAGNRIDKHVEEKKRRLKKITRPLLTNEIPRELQRMPQH